MGVRLMASEMTADPAEAELIVSDRVQDVPGGAAVIRSCDLDKMIALINGKTDL